MSVRTKKHEGFRSRPYKDTRGKWTVGYGFNLQEPHVAKAVPNAVKLGLRDLTTQEADAIYAPLYAKAQLDAQMYAGKAWNQLDPVRQEALTDMSYQLGGPKLAKFKNMNAALQKGDYVRASQEALNSDYAKQVPRRARENAKLIMLGSLAIPKSTGVSK